MKPLYRNLRFLLAVLFLLTSGLSYAQTPEGINYQALARVDGIIVSDGIISVKFTIRNKKLEPSPSFESADL